MTRWRPQHFKQEGIRRSISRDVVANAVAVAEVTATANPNIPPVFTLRHLAYLASVNYGFLRAVVSRKNLNPYRLFRIRKRPSHKGEQRFRIIAVPDPHLLKVQQWITQEILGEAKPHSASVAFSKGDRLLSAAEPHCLCRWLIKLDVRNFFESISEIAAYRVFLSLGYQPLISFELARLCTRLRLSSFVKSSPRWWAGWWRWTTILAYQVYRPGGGDRMGHLPQGAPTSPMLANLAMREFDKRVTQVSERHGLVYTRYADDLTFSTQSNDFSRDKCSAAIGEVYAAMGSFGLSPNATKTRIVTPGARKIVLGLLVDGPKPKLSKDFKAKMRQHIYYLARKDIGVVAHARRRGFSSVVGMKNHLFGLASFATQIEPVYGKSCLEQLKKIDWPL